MNNEQLLKYFKKAGIDVISLNKEEILICIKKTQEEKKISIKKLEQYLFICMVDYINDFK